jgi:exosortase/archaeosortase family protein
MLRALGVEAHVVNQVFVGGGGFQVQIAHACDGLNAISILAAGILAFPASLRARALGLLLGLPILVIMNVVRVTGLFLVGLYVNRLFSIVHIYAFQVSLIAVAVACFLVWARSVSTGHMAQRSAGDEIRA